MSFFAILLRTTYNIDRNFRDPLTGKRVWKPSWLSAYVPLLVWLIVSLTSTTVILLWHAEVFRGLDRLSTYLQKQGSKGRFVFGFLIFATTFPPLPLYSTLIVLCGYTFGLWQSFVISYVSSLLGAIVVFLLSRSLLKKWMSQLLNKSGGLKKVVRAIEKRPRLLFLVRLAPYPYNLMNTLLASSPTLTLQTYTLCTALALPKLLVHCALGTSIGKFVADDGAGTGLQASDGVSSGRNNAFSGSAIIETATLNASNGFHEASASDNAKILKNLSSFVGIGLCIGIFVYLLLIARKAVDEELDDSESLPQSATVLLDVYDILERECNQSDKESNLDVAFDGSTDTERGSTANQF